MRNAARILAGIAAVGAAVLVCRVEAAQPAPKTAAACPTCCDSPQSPRELKNWDRTERVATVSQGDGSSIIFSPRPGARLVLHPCSQHYHCQVENVQCPGQQGSTESACPPTLQPGSWVEIHTAYHAGPAVNPLPENLDSCRVGPVVVVGYHAKAISGPAGPPVPVLFGPPAAEWWGSSTNAGPPSCKNPAFWHFALGCNFTVSALQLRNQFRHPDRARALQAPNRLSRDLTLIEAPKEPR
jgi:hypothetical protein